MAASGGWRWESYKVLSYQVPTTWGYGYAPDTAWCVGEGRTAYGAIVDLAGETGGNCELTEPGEIVVKHGVTIASPLNLPATMPEHASELYSKNIAALLELMLVDGKLAPDFGDQVLADSCVTREVEA